MANEKTPPAPAAPVATPNRGKRMLFIVLGAVVLLLLVGAVAMFFLLKSSSTDDDDEEDATEVTEKHSKAMMPTYVKLDKFTVNLKPADDGSGEAYMQVDITLQIDGPEANARLTSLMPRIKNDIIFIMSDKQASALANREGKEALAGEIRDTINRILNPFRQSDNQPPKGPVEAVVFESLIIQ